ncbi:AAA family ATPase [Reinekea marinisedimentorum]|uniref:Putative ATP-binding protein involved in virulence n=1 Tax=Reinekea marinisedimentorum TaxID=230495 RepID=A0A4R3I0I8_9GAMM|nr:AAA family ATPase [Reinekea marinisedimentorum]TCS38085.1 putative ATP-binding protein involved in virulence [Reinekea marinisedimentorum]
MIDSGVKRHRATIRKLESAAKNGDIRASFQLYKYYGKGQFVEQDVAESNKYLSIFLESIKNYTISLSSLALFDFRIFKSVNIEFPRLLENKHNSVIIVGNNGVGKTTILEAIAKSLSWLANTIMSESGQGKKIDSLDINNDSEHGYASIISKLSFCGSQIFTTDVTKVVSGADVSKRGEYEDIKTLGSMFRVADSNVKDFNLPLIAFYSVERAIEVIKKDIEWPDDITPDGFFSKHAGYSDSLNGSTDFKQFFRWFKDLDDLRNEALANSSPLTTELAALEGQGKVLKDMLESGNANITTLESMESDIRNKIAVLKDKLSKRKTSNPQALIDMLSNAISGVMPGYKNLRVSRKPLGLLIEKNEETLNILQLSQGERSLIALIADIARRLILLNPNQGNPLEGKGIVLVDEIDLHLHPEWQQRIVRVLESTFPNIQFIFSTHSPTVLTTVPYNNILSIGMNVEDDLIVSRPRGNSYAETSGDVMHQIMYVDPLPPLPEVDQYKKLSQKIESGILDREVIDSIEELKRKLGDGHSLIVRLDRSIKRIKALQRAKS